MHRIRIPIEMEADISSLPLSCLVRCARQVEAEPTVGLPMAWILSVILEVLEMLRSNSSYSA